MTDIDPVLVPIVCYKSSVGPMHVTSSPKYHNAQLFHSVLNVILKKSQFTPDTLSNGHLLFQIASMRSFTLEAFNTCLTSIKA